MYNLVFKYDLVLYIEKLLPNFMDDVRFGDTPLRASIMILDSRVGFGTWASY